MYILPRLCSRHLRQVLQKSCSRNLSTSSQNVPHVCIVGSGPAGFYTAQQILKGHPAAKVDILEKLPVPFGLVRFGVAPDHPEVKNVIHTFTNTARNKRCTFLGNVDVGKDVSIEELQGAYTAVVLAYGADDDRTLAIKGEKTDISQHALDALTRSRVRKVYLVGRRGPLQVAFTIKEIREMIKLPNCRPVIHKDDVKDLNKVIEDLPRPRKRLTDLLYRTSMEPSDTDTQLWAQASKEWELRFRLTPAEVIETEGKVTGVKFYINELQGDDLVNKIAKVTSETEDIQCGLVFRSIGYKSIPIDPCLPFDERKGIILNKKGRVENRPGLYCSGWVSTGPVGVILNTMTWGFETGKVILKDIEDGAISSEGKHGNQIIKDKMLSKGKQLVTFSEWDKIDLEEMKRGAEVGKPREKIIQISEMLKVASS
uniref:NADPH:adrenodoxin oxidoreductase, mitochondrial n=1 Tax=Magallana gigas TaxID=29159 RepID=A0A8W8LU04_MAGGI